MVSKSLGSVHEGMSPYLKGDTPSWSVSRWGQSMKECSRTWKGDTP